MRFIDIQRIIFSAYDAFYPRRIPAKSIDIAFHQAICSYV